MLGKLDAQNLQKDILTNTGEKINLIEFDIKSQPMNLLAKDILTHATFQLPKLTHQPRSIPHKDFENLLLLL